MGRCVGALVWVLGNGMGGWMWVAWNAGPAGDVV